MGNATLIRFQTCETTYCKIHIIEALEAFDNQLNNIRCYLCTGINDQHLRAVKGTYKYTAGRAGKQQLSVPYDLKTFDVRLTSKKSKIKEDECGFL